MAMDLTDLTIIKLLLRNSRLTYRELAERLGVTVNAVYKRVQKLDEEGVIRKYTALPNLQALQGLRVLIAGYSKATKITEISKKIGEHLAVFFVGIAGGKYLFIDGELQDRNDLAAYSKTIQSMADIEEPFVGIVKQPTIVQPKKFSGFETMVIESLKNDARKSSVTIANELNTSAKRVRKTIDSLQQTNSVDFSIFWAPDSERDIIGNFQISLHENQNMNKEGFTLMQRYPNIVYFQTFSNKPRQLMLTTWFSSSRKLQAFSEELEAKGFAEVLLRVIYNGYFFETWRTNYFGT